MEYFGKKIAIECKTGTSPSLTKGNYNVIDYLKPDKTFVAAPVKTGWPVQQGIEVVNPVELIQQIEKIING